MSVDVSGLPDRTRVRVTIGGVIHVDEHTGERRVQVLMDGLQGYVRVASCVSVEPLPVTPDPGKWYHREGSPIPRLCLPDRRLITYRGFPIGEPWGAPMFSQPKDVLVECEPPAEFRDGQ